MPPSQDAVTRARARLVEARDKLQTLQTIDPYLIHLSLRENPFGSCIGQTLKAKLAILPVLRKFGFKNILLGTLDYRMPEELEVDDLFMMHLRDNDIDMTGGFVFTDVGVIDDGGTFVPSASMVKMKDYGVPNTLHEIYLSPEGMTGKYTLEQLKAILPASVAWLNANIKGDGGKNPPRILINIVDGCDAFQENQEGTFEILQLLATLSVEGVSIEDDRGTYMPFQVGAFVAAARLILQRPYKIVVHMHSGAGFENASVIEALLNDADGCWGGLPKRAAIIGHASLGELIANLLRARNANMFKYRVDGLLPLAAELQTLDEGAGPIPDDLPIFGRNAYRLTLDFFRQTDRMMDLRPDIIGGTYGYRVAPLGSDEPILLGRLVEVTAKPPESFDPNVLTNMIRVMRADLRAGDQFVYDDPDTLVQLYVRAGGTPP